MADEQTFPRRFGKYKLLAELGTSSEKLESLCLLAYEKPLAWRVASTAGF